MNRRGAVQKKHERFLINSFLAWYNSEKNSEYKIIEEPDPPEAIIRWGNKTSWIEVVDIFYSSDLARDKYSYATPDEEHIPMSTGLHQTMDENFSIIFTEELRKKLRKQSYLSFKSNYGPGILIIGIHHPWFDEETITMMKETLFSVDSSENLGCFEKIYISFSSLNKQIFKLWPMEA